MKGADSFCSEVCGAMAGSLAAGGETGCAACGASSADVSAADMLVVCASVAVCSAARPAGDSASCIAGCANDCGSGGRASILVVSTTSPSSTVNSCLAGVLAVIPSSLGNGEIFGMKVWCEKGEPRGSWPAVIGRPKVLRPGRVGLLKNGVVPPPVIPCAGGRMSESSRASGKSSAVTGAPAVRKFS